MALPSTLYVDPQPWRAGVFGKAINFVPGNPTIPVEVQRATDNIGTGATTIATGLLFPKPGAPFVDQRANDGSSWFYRARHGGPGVDAGAYTAWVGGVVAAIPNEVLAASVNYGGGSVYPLIRSFAFDDTKYAVVAADNAGVKADRTVGVDGGVRTLYASQTHLLPNGEFEVWQSASQPHAWTVDTGDSSVAAKDTGVVFSGDAAAKFSFGAGGSAATWRGFATNDPTKGAQCVPLRPGFRYRIIAASRVSTLTGAPAYRLRVQYDAGGTLTDSKSFTYRAATTYQRDEWVITVPTAAEANTKVWIEFQRNDTNAKDYWADSIRIEEEVASLADQAALLASQGTSFVINGQYEDGVLYWRQTSGGSLFATASAPISGSKSGAILSVGGATHRVQQCDRVSDIVDSADGTPLYVPVEPLDEISGQITFKSSVLNAASPWKFGIEEYDAAKALIQRTYLGTGFVLNGSETLRGGVVLQATTQYVVPIVEVLPTAGFTGITVKFDDFKLFWSGKKMRCHRYKAADQTLVATATETKVVLDSTLWQVATMDGTADRITLPAEFLKTGTVTIRGQVEFAGPAVPAGYRQVRIKKNGATFLAKARIAAVVTANLETTVQVAVEDHLAAPADYYELWATHNQGANMTLTHGSDLTFLQVVHRP